MVFLQTPYNRITEETKSKNLKFKWVSSSPSSSIHLTTWSCRQNKVESRIMSKKTKITTHNKTHKSKRFKTNAEYLCTSESGEVIYIYSYHYTRIKCEYLIKIITNKCYTHNYGIIIFFSTGFFLILF